MSTVIEVRYSETDRMGIVHHSRYFPLFEVARGDKIKEIGMSYADMEKMGVMIPLIESGAKYIEGLRYGDSAEILCDVTALSPAKCEFSYTVKRIPDGKIMTTGFTRHGFVDSDFKAMNLKKKFPELYEKLEKMLCK
ncbi:MAG: thioesterase family protein [Clostridia bacterium]|nr:thioesterase family protein [Clostridia bacterium]